MTIVCSIASTIIPFMTMTVDSVVTLDFQDGHLEYDNKDTTKSFYFEGVGCVGTWGARDGNQVGTFLREKEITSTKYSVDDLADIVYQYLTEHYKPREIGLDDVGYHVGGFDRKGQPRLYHIFWGFNRPRHKDETTPGYYKYDHSPEVGSTQFLYNGRNELAQVVVETLLNEVRLGREVRFDIKKPEGLARFGDFVARFAAELTPEVGPPFRTYLISASNRIQRIENKSFAPVGKSQVSEKLKLLESNEMRRRA